VTLVAFTLILAQKLLFGIYGHLFNVIIVVKPNNYKYKK